jgi:ketosteroid isomerase-like protein
VSQADIEMLRAGYADFSRGEWDAVLAQAAPDFELKTADRVTSPGTYRGRDTVRRFFEDMFAPFEEVLVEPEEFHEIGDRILALVRVRSRPRGSSAFVENRIGHLWTMQDGAVVALQVFPERERALEAVGIEP